MRNSPSTSVTVVEKFCSTEVAESRYILTPMNKGKAQYERKTDLGKWVAKRVGQVGRKNFWEVRWEYYKQAF